jgi:nitrogen fixation protein NifU and related proteins
MSDLEELYQSIILDHNRRPRNYGEMPGTARRAEGNNPLCGDRLTVWVRLGDDEMVDEVSFVAQGCAISRASASLMTAEVKGKSRAEVERLFDRFHQLVTGKVEQPESDPDLKRLRVFSGVSKFPIRVKCASLSWHALKAALDAPESTVSTE